MNIETISKFRGFNLMNMFCSKSSEYYATHDSPGCFYEDDFRMIRELGFNFVRIPLSYRIWGSPDDLFFVDERKLAALDKAVEFADKYSLHINIAMHRAPGYCVNEDEPVREPLDLWNEPYALRAFRHHFHKIAERYVGIPEEKLSYNILNEPPHFASALQYLEVCRGIIDEIRSLDAKRLISVDGLAWGCDPPFELIRHEEPNILYSCRGYDPSSLTHFGLEDVPDKDGTVHTPVWPGKNIYKVGYHPERDFYYGSKQLQKYVGLWGAVQKIYKVPVMCGEFGVYRKTPHGATLAYMDELLSAFRAQNIGYALWQFRGPFGVMDSGREDVRYEDFHGHKLDVEMLKVLQKY